MNKIRDQDWKGQLKTVKEEIGKYRPSFCGLLSNHFVQGPIPLLAPWQQAVLTGCISPFSTLLFPWVINSFRLNSKIIMEEVNNVNPLL